MHSVLSGPTHSRQDLSHFLQDFKPESVTEINSPLLQEYS